MCPGSSLMQGKDVFPIPGTKHVKYLQENISAFEIKLSPEEIDLLEQAVPASEVICNCSNEWLAKFSRISASCVGFCGFHAFVYPARLQQLVAFAWHATLIWLMQ